VNEPLYKRIASRLRAGALVVVVQDPDELLTVSQAMIATKGWSPIEVVSVSDPEITDKIEKHLKGELENDRGEKIQTLITLDYLSATAENPLAVRSLRQFALQVRADKDTRPFSRLILIEQPFVKIPQGLVGDSEVVTNKLPGTEELSEELTAFIKSQGIELPGNGEMKYALASACSGLPRHEAARLFARCWVEKKVLDPSWLRTEKALRVTQRLQGALSFEDTDGADIGGADLLKQFLTARKAAFGSAKAREYGLPEPKGLLLLGPPGTGKSALVRYIARLMGLPVQRLDPGRLMGSLVGQSEMQTRQALEAAEASAPCILWIDEIEKGLGGAGGSLDGGTTSRVFGTILTWLQEKKSAVFVVATANNVKNLPPELLRAGRFDAIFYIGLPTVEERRDIVEIHLKRRNRTLQEIHVKALAEATEGYSGAEIEQAIVESMFSAFSEDRDIVYQDVLTTVKGMVPLSRTRAEELEALDKWAQSRARPASSQCSWAKKVKKSSPDDLSEDFTVQRPRIG
jgi:hypothetical protein